MALVDLDGRARTIAHGWDGVVADIHNRNPGVLLLRRCPLCRYVSRASARSTSNAALQ
jgi:hypothetical protein